MAIDSLPSKCATVGEIYHWIEEQFPYYRTGAPWWKNCIRHNLSMKKTFVRVQRAERHYWSISPDHYAAVMQAKHTTNKATPKKRRRTSSLTTDDLQEDESPKTKIPCSPKTRPSSQPSSPTLKRGISKVAASPPVVASALSMPTLPYINQEGEQTLADFWLPAMTSAPDSLLRIAARSPSCRATPFKGLVEPCLDDALMSWDWGMPLVLQGQ